jgi:transcriptional regulator with XRE-family HTH domain
VAPFDLSGALRRIRRLTDLSQRELADRCGLSQSAVAQAESGRRDLPAGDLARAAALAGLRLALLDRDGHEIGAMAPDRVRDLRGRRFPAHLDTVHADERWWRYEHRFDRSRPSFTFDRHREGRDSARRRSGTQNDHHLPDAGEFPHVRRRADLAGNSRAFAGDFRAFDEGVDCICPAHCDELDDRSGKPVHAPGCPCDCDVA